MTATPPSYPFYGPDGQVISEVEAMDMMVDVEGRTVAMDVLWFAGREVRVYTVFVPVDMNGETWGRLVERPTCWVTEIVGGPDDMNGVVEYSASLEEARQVHALVLERATTSGCERG